MGRRLLVAAAVALVLGGCFEDGAGGGAEPEVYVGTLTHSADRTRPDEPGSRVELMRDAWIRVRGCTIPVAPSGSGWALDGDTAACEVGTVTSASVGQLGTVGTPGYGIAVSVWIQSGADEQAWSVIAYPE